MEGKIKYSEAKKKKKRVVLLRNCGTEPEHYDSELKHRTGISFLGNLLQETTLQGMANRAAFSERG